MLDFLHNRVIQFQGNILGFEQLNEFVIQIVEENGPYAYLQSTEDEHIGFLVAAPFAFYSDYAFEIDDSDRNHLQLNAPDDAAVVAIVTIQEPFESSTMNLLAPIVINVKTSQGKQIVLPPKTTYSTKEALFRTPIQEKEETASANSDT
ncbi:flagellar assembly protein FliW [Paenibacillus chartarius]|uniref:Flagellar assembly factor FliW n=1 Tax=Paenibacillus chartarius TaxID=747481 RepID=A0ABV6DJT1_9BACL